MSHTELRRAMVMQKVLASQITVREAAEVLSLSERQIKRLKAGMKDHGVASLAHKNRGRRPKHSIPDSLRQQVVTLASGPYRGANYSHFTELIARREGIELSISSVTRILKAAGIRSSRRHKPGRPHRSRPRKPQFGMLVQIDASSHAWLEKRGPNLTLLGAIDDATGLVVGALFRPSECLEGYFALMRQVISIHGLPLALYSDRHTIFFAPENTKLSVQQELDGQFKPQSQFGRAMAELQIEHIPARSPQAKGRIERLWNTFQDRLVLELRLADATDLESANAALASFVTQYNHRFAVAPELSAKAWRSRPRPELLTRILCQHEVRIVSHGSSVSYAGQAYQLVKGDEILPLTAGTKVTLHIGPDGAPVEAAYAGSTFGLTAAAPARSRSTIPYTTQPRTETPGMEKAGPALHRKPAPRHPWRRPVVWPKDTPVNLDPYQDHYTLTALTKG